MCRYDNLEKMLHDSDYARNYFNSLPEHIRTDLMKNGLRIYTENEMMDYAERLLHDFV